MRRNTLEVLDDPELTDWQRAMLFQNIQRTRLSNERNFLNWVRASVAFITLGFVVHRFELFASGQTEVVNGGLSSVAAFWVPLLFFTLGGVTVGLSTWEYFRVSREVDQGIWLPTKVLRGSLVCLLVASLVVVLVLFVLARV